MIYIDRTRHGIIIPDVLLKKGGLGDLERQTVKAHYSNPKAGPFDDYKVYSHPDVKAALMNLCYNKCVYCESEFGHITPGDVEHFRPKNQIKMVGDTIVTPGYYWLASDWNNLLMSCEFCNRKRSQEIEDQDRKVSLGKQDNFALRSGIPHAKPFTSLAKEEINRLLIDPCKDQPEQYLEFDEKANIKPRRDSKGQVSDRGEYSIKVLGLQRWPLVKRRRKFFLKQVKSQVIELDDLRKVIALLDPKNPAMRLAIDAQNALIDRKVNSLMDLMGAGQEYAGLARQYLLPILKERTKSIH